MVEGFINTVFLKARAIKKETGFDFYDKQQRDLSVERFVRELLDCRDPK
jgi:hypothetical protein